MHDSSELVFAGFSVTSADFTCKSAIDYSWREIIIFDAIFAYADDKNIAVELVERLRQRELRVFVHYDFERRDDFAELFVTFHFDEANSAATGVLKILVAQIKKFFGEAVIRDDQFPR